MGLSPALCYLCLTGLSPALYLDSYGVLSGTISHCGVTSVALSGINASTTGLQNLMQDTPGHAQP